MGKRINTLNTASSPANDDYLPIDGATNGTRKISADFVNNLITDVEVDGTSVVTSGVAEIDLSGKQDTLTAGSNIQIAQDGTISATDTTYTAGTNVQINNNVISATDTTYTAGTNVQIDNGVISATDTTYTAGTNVQINNGVISATDTTYSAFGGATAGADGSSGLVPQPLIADKDKFLKGDGTWDTIQPGASALDDLTNVDITSPTNGQVLKYDSTNQEWVNANESGGGGGASAVADLTDVNLTSLANGQILKYDSTSQKWINSDESGGGNLSYETVFSGSKSTSAWNSPLVFNEFDVTACDIIRITAAHDSYSYTWLIDTSIIPLTGGNTLHIYGEVYCDRDDTELQMYVSTGHTLEVSKIESVISGGGGSSVIPNPTGTPTDTLDTVSIDGTIYEIQGSGGGSGTYTSTLLNDGTAVQDVLTLSSDYTNFDELLITWMYDNNLYITTLKLNTSDISINDTITLDDYYARDMVLTVTSTTAFTITSQTSGMGILSIRGFTYSKTAKEKNRDVLWTTGSWTMAHPITDYDEIIFKWDGNSSTSFIPTDIMTYQSFIVFKPANNSFMWFDVTDASNFTVHQDTGLTITSVEGVVYTKDEPAVFAEEMTLDEYNALTTAQKNDGTIRFIPAGSGGGVTTPYDMSSISTSFVQGSMRLTATSSTETTVEYVSGQQIGCNWNYPTPIDVTNISTIHFKATNGSCYGGGAQAQQTNWNLQIGLTASAIGDQALNINASDSRWAAVADMPLANHVYEGSIDVSELMGSYYLLVVAHGWNTVIEDITLDTGGAYPSQIKYMSKTYGLGESGEGYTEDILYSATSTTEAPAILTLSHAYTDYDMLIFNLWRSADGVMNKYDRFILTSQLNISDRIQLITYNEYASYDITTTTSFTLINENRMYIGSVVGLKFGEGGGGGGSSEITYSTTEHKVGTWIDGSDVYEKVISISNVSLSSGSYETVDTITGLDTIISCNGYVVEGNLKYTLNDITLRVIQDGTSVKLYSPSGTAWTISSGAIIIRYTKVTAS